MLWPHAGLRRVRNVELQQHLAAAHRESPESETWLGLLEAALAESEDGAGWEAAVPTPAPDRPAKAPLLAHARITVDGRAVRRWVGRLLKRARQDGKRIDAVALLEAAVCQDDGRVEAQAAAAGAAAPALRVVGQMAAVPLLQACARGLAGSL